MCVRWFLAGVLIDAILLILDATNATVWYDSVVAGGELLSQVVINCIVTMYSSFKRTPVEIVLD